jgi:2-C-methyl-D-erythritol 2,4-cyclodiphosphate synthase
MTIGFGFDVHPLVKKRRLILGGVEIPFDKGLKGHSDADVLIHAIGDAILGALAEGDLGKHFPDTDSRYKGISSLILLKKISILAKKKGYRVKHLDSTVVTEKPKLKSYINTMEKKIADILAMKREKVNVKAKTTEGLGFIGRGEGIAAYAVVLLEKGRR